MAAPSRDHVAALARLDLDSLDRAATAAAAVPSYDALRAQLAAATAERDALRAAVREHLAADASLTDAFESARSISANSSALAEVMAAWKAHGVAIDRAQRARHALDALLPTVTP